MRIITRLVTPGDVIRLDGEYWGATVGALAVVDGSHFGIDFDDDKGPQVLVVFEASAFRQHGKVSCSGGPCPFIPQADLVYEGATTRTFWRWADEPRAGGGVNYTDEVALWSWTGDK